MKITYHEISSHAMFAIGHVEETLDELLSKYDFTLPPEVEGYHEHKKVEHVTTRVLLKELCEQVGEEYKGITKDEHGKPFLVDSNSQISVSHSYPYVSCMIDKLQPCGIDLETPRDQLGKVKTKFLNQREQKQIGDDIELLCQYWCAKEALYKIHGRRKLTFNEQLNVKIDGKNSFAGEIKADDVVELYNLKSHFFEGHYLVHNI